MDSSATACLNPSRSWNEQDSSVVVPVGKEGGMKQSSGFPFRYRYTLTTAGVMRSEIELFG